MFNEDMKMMLNLNLDFKPSSLLVGEEEGAVEFEWTCEVIHWYRKVWLIMWNRRWMSSRRARIWDLSRFALISRNRRNKTLTPKLFFKIFQTHTESRLSLWTIFSNQLKILKYFCNSDRIEGWPRGQLWPSHTFGSDRTYLIGWN